MLNKTINIVNASVKFSKNVKEISEINQEIEELNNYYNSINKNGFIYTYLNNKVHTKYYYLNNIRHGPQYEYYENEYIEYFYNYGKLFGYYNIFNLNGRFKERREYLDDKLHGYITIFDGNGNIISQKKYYNNELVNDE